MANKGISPAALGAALNGDLENFLVASIPGGIEAQEARGQRDLCASARLPKEIPASLRAKIEQKWGVKFGDDADDLFVNVTLPSGWKLQPTDHSMHNDLVDDKGRKRAGIFYKAAFYDRKASFSACNRYSTVFDSRGDEAKLTVVDNGTNPPTQLFDTGFGKYGEVGGRARAWLTEHYPDTDPFAYWE